MLDEKKSTPHFSSPQGTHPSLLPLRMVLLAAVGASPARPPRMDVNEQCAIRLIEKVRAGYKKQQLVLTWDDIPSPFAFRKSLHETTVTHIG